MLSCFDFIRNMSFLAVAVRLTLAMICGGIIGLEREYKRRPAGFRTHILICLGAAMTTLTSQYLCLEMHFFTDVGRLGAQVIAGIGFIGAGTIIVTNRKQVKGLTTAAGLWTSAIIGLVCGAGYVECALAATLAVIVAELLLIKLEYRFARQVHDVILYIEYAHASCIENIIRVLKEEHIKINGLEISRVTGEGDEHYYCAVLTLQASKRQLDQGLVKNISSLEDVRSVEEL